MDSPSEAFPAVYDMIPGRLLFGRYIDLFWPGSALGVFPGQTQLGEGRNTSNLPFQKEGFANFDSGANISEHQVIKKNHAFLTPLRNP